MLKRKSISISIAFAFIIIAATGVFMYLRPYDKVTSSIHTFFGLAFLLLAALHLKNNWVALKNYSKEKKKGARFSLTKPFVAISLIMSISLVGLFSSLPPFSSFYEWGNGFRNEQVGKTIKGSEFELIRLPNALGEIAVEVEVKKGPAFQYPLFVIWAEDMEGNYLQTLYVSRSIATSVFQYGKKAGDQWEPAVVRRPEALPRWSHKRGVKSVDGYYLPVGGNQDDDLDGYTGATPFNDFMLNTKLQQREKPAVRIFLEVNQSYDWNEYYNQNRFPGDEVYSGSGKVGQPAIVYSAEIFLKEGSKQSYFLEPVGHSHHSGETGELFADLSNISTALEIVDRVIITIRSDSQTSRVKASMLD